MRGSLNKARTDLFRCDIFFVFHKREADCHSFQVRSIINLGVKDTSTARWVRCVYCRAQKSAQSRLSVQLPPPFSFPGILHLKLGYCDAEAYIGILGYASASPFSSSLKIPGTKSQMSLQKGLSHEKTLKVLEGLLLGLRGCVGSAAWGQTSYLGN